MHHSIEVDHLSFTYPDGHQALRDVSLHIAPGEKVALAGPNGAGKSTLLLHLNGILPGSTRQPDRHEQERLVICGLPLQVGNLRRIRAAVGLVFQNPDDQLFSPTVFDDVAFGPIYQGQPAEEVNQRVTEALAAVHMEGYARRVSHHLSMGEKKRIAIATVLSMQPEVLVLDEPTAGLDPRTRRAFIRLLQELPMTMLISSHDMPLVNELFTRMVIMDDGRIVADGETRILMQDEVLLQAHGLERP